jgi:hypothetical protein
MKRPKTFLCITGAILAVAPAGHAAGGNTAPAVDTSKIKAWNGACGDPVMDYPRWKGFPVRLCKYSDIGVTVKTYMLNADSAKIATWFVTACTRAGATRMQACVDYLAAETNMASSMGVFPVAGYIPEPELGGRCFLFRDGVTVTTKSYPHQLKPVGGACGADETTTPLRSAGLFARISSTTRADYAAAGGTRPVARLAWVDVTRDLYQQAWNSDENPLITAKAIAGLKAKAFR